MCGLTGFLDTTTSLECEAQRTIVRRMAGSLLHRGPDDGGEWTDEKAGIALGFRRLSIVDLSPAGHQPMVSASGRFVIAFNGEVYNFGAVRSELAAAGLAPDYRGGSDTEVMLAAFEAWGVEEAVRRFLGMFAFALWDREQRTLHLGRDRLGVKPLYYGWAGKTLLFGSELKALRAHPGFDGKIDRDALALMLRYDYIPAPYSIYRGFRKLPAGTILTLSADRKQESVPIPYWSAKSVAEAGVRTPFEGSDAEATEHLEGLLRDSIGLRMIADVPLGVFLSGGVDSSVVVALMQAQSSRPVKSFTIGFREESYNEAQHARGVAKHLGTDHTELIVSPEEAMAVIPRLPALYDEPFADPSQIPTYLVSQLARKSVTVSLSGDGGDELFGGYNRYFWGRSLWKRLGRIPRPLRGAGAGLMNAVSPGAWDSLFRMAGPLLPAGAQQRNPGDKIAKLAEIMGADGPDALYLALVSHWKHPTELVDDSEEPPTPFTDRAQWANLADFTQRMMFLDTVSYLPDDILVKVDRASMGVSLEAREPLLDHRILEFAWRLPMSMKIREGQGKWLLRQVLYKYVPQTLIERPKTGFGVPIDEWLRGPLRDWAESLLAESALRGHGVFNPAPIRKKWAEHLSGRHNWQYYLWNILMVQAWLEGESTG
ncbi:MAG: asnB [Chthonomonadaceae bacterium]|nr:asnB [Chthonomonadaceae bacterium]